MGKLKITVRIISASAVILSAIWLYFKKDLEPAITFLFGLAGFISTFVSWNAAAKQRINMKVAINPKINREPYELGSTEFDEMKADPEIGHLINKQNRYQWANPEKAGSRLKKGYTYFLTEDGRRCYTVNRKLVLLVKRVD